MPTNDFLTIRNSSFYLTFINLKKSRLMCNFHFRAKGLSSLSKKKERVRNMR